MIGQYENQDKKNGQGGPDEIKGNNKGVYVVPHPKVKIVTITQASLGNNKYTVTEPVTRIEGLKNKGAEKLSFTVNDTIDTSTVELDPDEIYDMDYTGFTEITFSVGAVFRADLMR